MDLVTADRNGLANYSVIQCDDGGDGSNDATDDDDGVDYDDTY